MFEFEDLELALNCLPKDKLYVKAIKDGYLYYSPNSDTFYIVENLKMPAKNSWVIRIYPRKQLEGQKWQ